MRALGLAIVAGMLVTGAAHAQAIVVSPGVVVASDIDGPYDDVGPPPPPRYSPYPQAYPPPQAYPAPQAYPPPPPAYGPSAYAPALPIHEIMRIVRQGGFSPLGAPQQRGNVVTISVIDPDGEDGRLVIDAYSGRILRFVPAYRMGARGVRAVPVAYGPYMGPSLRPPASVPTQRASVPLPKPRVAALTPSTERMGSVTPRPEAQAKIPPVPPAALAAAPATPTTGAAPSAPAAKPPVALQPTQAAPPAQGLE